MKHLKEAVDLCSAMPTPWRGIIMVDKDGFTVRLRHGELSHNHIISWRHIEEVKPGINPLIFALAHCKREIEKQLESLHEKTP